ncbi:ABC transporter ATP-binding protein [Paenibacillus medicaginis]|uniref:ATP-binding cassette domain-containing protein n=1 Tax=Paenibacillus medicaginis TaxID=1470560 RepID=A0ABV5C7T8_9BACL
MDIIQVDHLYKKYSVKQQREGLIGGIKDLIKPIWNEKEAVKHINFCVKKGETVGYIGPNGSGKSTTIKMLTGILTPSSGKIIVNGLEPYKERKKNAVNIGVVFGQRTQLWWDLAIRESLELFKYIYRVPDKVFRENRDKMVELLKLDEFYSTPVRQLSLGQRMRAEIAAAFLHSPSIVFLDEPTIGLDVVAKEQVRKFLREINKEKETTIILTTHDMDDIEQVCDRLLMINDGVIIFDGKMKSFIDAYGNERIITVQFEEPIANIDIDYGDVLSIEENKVKILFQKEKISATQIVQNMSQKYPVVDCHLEEPKIEFLIRQVYEGRELNGNDKIFASR